MASESYVRRRAKQMGFTLLRSGHLDDGYALAIGDMISFGGVRGGHVVMNECRATLEQILHSLRGHAAFKREVERTLRRDGGDLPDPVSPPERKTTQAVKAIMAKALRT